MKELQKKLGYTFKNEKLLEQALTHSSYANSYGVKSYETLEFLGDSLLSAVISLHIYNNYAFDEGGLSIMRARIVCEQSLAACSRRLGFGTFLRVDKGADLTGARDNQAILADVFESVIAAMYLDGGEEEVGRFIMDNLGDTVAEAAKGKIYKDNKSSLQEQARHYGKSVEYQTIAVKGPEHNPTYFVEVYVGGELYGEGEGRNKKEAEQNAASEALGKMAD